MLCTVAPVGYRSVVSAPAGSRVDGRRARRERNRSGVIDAMLALLHERGRVPSAEELAARAGVSVSSVFRYFENLDDLLHQTIDTYLERYEPLFVVPDLGAGSLDRRIRTLADARLNLYEATAAIARIARRRAAEEERVAAALGEVRERLRRQLETHFAPELAGLSPAATRDTVAAIDVLTSFEGWDLLVARDLGRRQIRTTWIRGIGAVLAGT